MRIDELIRNWSVNGYKDPFADREIILTQRELEDIIHEAAENTQRFVEYRIEGTTVYATFSSIFKHFRGDKIDCPMRLYRPELIADLAKQSSDRRERAKIARAGGYSAKVIEGMLSKRRNEEE